MTAHSLEEPQLAARERHRRTPVGTVHTNPALLEAVTVFLREPYEEGHNSAEDPQLVDE
jgi:hypothetical protein